MIFSQLKAEAFLKENSKALPQDFGIFFIDGWCNDGWSTYTHPRPRTQPRNE